MDSASVSMDTARAAMDTVGESMDAMGAVMNGNVNQEKKKISLGCGQAHLTSSLRTPRNINLTIFLGKNAKNRAFLV